MREAAADLNFEEAARMRDEIKRLRTTELAVTDDPTAKVSAPARGAGGGSAGPRRQEHKRQGPHKPNLDQMGPGVEAVPGDRPAGRSKMGRPGMRGGFKPRRG
jgi:excinuclease ABC subunit B